MLSKKECLRRFYQQFQFDDQVLITIDPDPDALASALAVKRLLWRHVSHTKIALIRPIKRWNNIAMVKLLKIPCQDINSISTKDYSKFVLVDGQPHHNEVFRSFSYNVIIDHHPFQEVSYPCHPLECSIEKRPFFDIRPSYGSTSTILTEYLKTSRIKPSSSLATALAYGIKTDTRNFERQTLEDDIRAFLFLYPFVNRYTLNKIEISDLSIEDLKFFDEALKHYTVSKHRIFVFMDEVPSHDILVILSEFFLKLHEISFSVVAGIVDSSLVIVGRSDGRKHVGEFLKKAFGNAGSAGGHGAMGRAEIPLEYIRKKYNVPICERNIIEKFVFDSIE
ncbi:MAG: DHH family phosphoesterase [Syntrophobacterales bacterium]|nr:DHH family phosphoesterase [Syntrophobacterales bacterium]